MFFSGLSPAIHRDHQPGGRPPPFDEDGERTLVVLLTFGIFFSFVILYLVAGLVWSIVITASAIAMSFLYLKVRRRRAVMMARRGVGGGGDIVFVVGGSAHQAGGGGGADDSGVLSAMIPAFEYKRQVVNGGEDGGGGWAQCVICLGMVQVGEVVRRLPACKHMFHVDCIDAWLSSHSTCPICRADVVVDLAAGRLEPPV
uniref:RING-type E3 ubiquitin transferase n=1 Tax=Leersia perrieri TaxID=77586 RepID=A0A0D9WE95_9ORYZ